MFCAILVSKMPVIIFVNYSWARILCVLWFSINGNYDRLCLNLSCSVFLLNSSRCCLVKRISIRRLYRNVKIHLTLLEKSIWSCVQMFGNIDNNHQKISYLNHAPSVVRSGWNLFIGSYNLLTVNHTILSC
jgi:hypothetical protein